MGTFDPDVLLVDLRRSGQKLCFYPSSGNTLLWAVMQMEAHVFVFSDYSPQNAEQRKHFWRQIQDEFHERKVPLALVESTERTRVFRSGQKHAFLFFQDNNDALDRIKRAGWKVSTFVGIRDGCCEGGNHECVHAEPFLSRLLNAIAEPTSYFADHSELLEDHGETIRRQHTFFRTCMLHSSGWEFRLRCVLVIPASVSCDSHQAGFLTDDIARREVEAFYPSRGQDAPSFAIRPGTPEASACELLKLAEFRTYHNEGIIAHYDVHMPQQDAPADADKRRR